MALDAPTKEQKELFVDCLVNAMANTMRNKYGFLSSLKHTIAKVSKELGPDHQADLDYLNSVMRAAISLGDYMHYMKPSDYKQAFLAVVEAGNIDPVITDKLWARMGSIGMDKSSKSIANIPLLGPMLVGAGKAMESVSTSAWAANQLVRNERRHGEQYYPDNRNPAYRIWTKEERAAHKAAKAQSDEPAETIKLKIIAHEKLNDTFAGKVMSKSASVAKHFSK